MIAWRERRQLARDRAQWERLARPTEVAPWTIRSPWDPPIGDRDLILPPSFVFGSGMYHGTRAMLATIESLTRDLPRSAPVLDFGCGNAILAIVCAKLGFTDVEAIDIDEAALEAARQNARLNDCRIRVHSAPSDRPFSLVLANLPADVHPKVAESLRSLVAADGALLVTGYDTPAERGGLVDLYYAGGSFELAREEYSGQWSVIRFERKPR